LEDSFEGVKNFESSRLEGKKEQGRYALESAKKFLATTTTIFGVKFPLPNWTRSRFPAVWRRNGELGVASFTRVDPAF